MKVFAWSHSRWSDYDKCPEYYRHKYFDKISDGGDDVTPAMFGGDKILAADFNNFCEGLTDNPIVNAEQQKFIKNLPPMLKGTYKHRLAENFVRGVDPVLTEELELYKHEFCTLRELAARGEATWCFDQAWEPVDDMFDRSVRVRVKTDAHVLDHKEKLMRVIDYKTGKVKDYPSQMELYALAAFERFGVGQVAKVKVELWFLDYHVTKSDVFGAWQLPDLHAAWERRTRKMLADTRFDPKPTNFCRWCPYSQDKGGQCEY